METLQLVFVDEDSLKQGLHSLMEQAFVEEQKRLLSLLPAPYVAILNTIGFCRGIPVCILSPYAVPPGPLRKNWVDAFQNVRKRRASSGSFCSVTLATNNFEHLKFR